MVTQPRAQVYVNGGGPPGGYPTIQAAVNAVTTNGSLVQIDDVTAGNPTTYFENVVILGNMPTMTIMTMSNAFPPNVKVDGGFSGSVFEFRPVGNAVTSNATLIHGLTIEHGSGTLENGRLVGGGIACIDGSSPKIRNCVVRNNTADDGGGIYGGLVDGHTGPRIVRNYVRLNTAQNDGGGIYLEVSDFGEIFSGAPQFSSSRINENVAVRAGGGFFAGAFTRATISESFLHLNRVTGGGTSLGAGACFEGAHDVLITSTSIGSTSSGNDAGAGSGGGIAVVGCSNTIVEHSTVDGNRASIGAGIYDSMSSVVRSDYYDVLIVNNVATGPGGGLLTNSVGLRVPAVTFCTIANNTSGTASGGGGGIWHAAGVTVDHTIFWANAPNPFNTTPPGMTFSFTANPQFVPALSGCPYDTSPNYRLNQSTSPCVDPVGGPPVSNYPRLNGRSTNPNHNIADTGIADIGFHYTGAGCPP